jgi:hypothetical protein
MILGLVVVIQWLESSTQLADDNMQTCEEYWFQHFNDVRS